jgi:hypothetical protein
MSEETEASLKLYLNIQSASPFSSTLLDFLSIDKLYINFFRDV